MIEDCFVPVIRYLQLYEMGENGLIAHRDGGWNWFDHSFNQDIPVMENAWYYSSLKFARRMAEIIGVKAITLFWRNELKA